MKTKFETIKIDKANFIREYDPEIFFSWYNGELFGKPKKIKIA